MGTLSTCKVGDKVMHQDYGTLYPATVSRITATRISAILDGRTNPKHFTLRTGREVGAGEWCRSYLVPFDSEALAEQDVERKRNAAKRFIREFDFHNLSDEQVIELASHLRSLRDATANKDTP